MKATGWERDPALAFCLKLLEDGILVNVSHSTSNKFKDGKDRLYRLGPLPKPKLQPSASTSEVSVSQTTQTEKAVLFLLLFHKNDLLWDFIFVSKKSSGK